MVETERVLLIRRRRGSAPVWCEVCAEPTLMLTPEEAVAMTGFSLRNICSRIETGRLHFVEMTDGLLLICSGSLQHWTAGGGE